MHLDEPLSDKEFDELDQFLLSERCVEEGMTMDTLHGYLTALTIGPEEILMAEWLPHVWGPSDSDTPKFKSDKECERIVGLIVRFMNEIAITMEVAPKEFEPLFCEQEFEGKPLLDGEAWAWGFWEGVNLRKDAWDPLWTSNLADMARPIYLLGAEDTGEKEQALIADPMQRHKLSVAIEYAIPHIYDYWLPHRKPAMATLERTEPKIGRNDPCPCGSGKKYKKCCGEAVGTDSESS